MTLTITSDKSDQQPNLQPSAQSLVDALSPDLAPFKGNLNGACNGKAPRTLLVTSSKNGEGKTISSVSIAQTLNNDGQFKVLIIDANFRSPKLHQLYGIEQSAGFGELVLEDVPQESVCLSTSTTNLDLLCFGLLKQNPMEIFESDKFQKKLALLSQNYRYIVVDADSILTSSEVSLICPFFDGILMVIECESTKWQVVKIAADKINKAGGRLLGSILNRRKFYIPRFFYGT